ncbi:MAG: hypothetical protein K8E24_014300 [Methanobacterium paludis]|nr:hypothetical protein [Methanobacterium paludis]
MTMVKGNLISPKSLMLKTNTIIKLSNINQNSFEMILLNDDAIIDQYALDKFEGDITAYEIAYTGYARQTLTNLSRVDTIQNAYLFLADNVTFPALNGTLRYGLVVEKTTKDIVTIYDFGESTTFAGDITFNTSIYGFLKTEV